MALDTAHMALDTRATDRRPTSRAHMPLVRTQLALDRKQGAHGCVSMARWLDGLKALFCGPLVTLCGVSVRVAQCITALFAI